MSKTCIISFDIGRKNLAHCILLYIKTTKLDTILDWSLDDISNNHIDNDNNDDNNDNSNISFNLLIKLLQEIYSKILIYESNKKNIVVLIENQCKIKMIKIQCYIEMFFQINNIQTILCNGISKVIYSNKMLSFYTNTDYSSNKNIVSLYAIYKLKENNNNKKYIDFFENNSKKDDLADSYIQALAYFENNNVNSLSIIMNNINDNSANINKNFNIKKTRIKKQSNIQLLKTNT